MTGTGQDSMLKLNFVRASLQCERLELEQYSTCMASHDKQCTKTDQEIVQDNAGIFKLQISCTQHSVMQCEAANHHAFCISGHGALRLQQQQGGGRETLLRGKQITRPLLTGGACEAVIMQH